MMMFNYTSNSGVQAKGSSKNMKIWGGCCDILSNIDTFSDHDDSNLDSSSICGDEEDIQDNSLLDDLLDN